MSSTTTRRGLTTAASLILAALAITGTTAAQADDPGKGARPTETGTHHETDTALADAFSRVDRNTAWQQTSKLKLNFLTYHTEGTPPIRLLLRPNDNQASAMDRPCEQTLGQLFWQLDSRDGSSWVLGLSSSPS